MRILLILGIAVLTYLSPAPTSAAGTPVTESPGAVIATIPVGSSPAWLAFDTRNGDLYVANIFSDNVTVIDPRTRQVVETVPVGGAPAGVAADPRSGNVYVTTGNVVQVLAPLRG